MSIPKITGREARELLDIWSGDVEGLTFAQLGADRSYGDLFGAAPALAETVAWLYGKRITPDEAEGDYYSTFRGGYTYADQGRVHLNVALSDEFTPDEAVDLARALLAAAEEARP